MKYSAFFLAIALLFVHCKSDEPDSPIEPDNLVKQTITFPTTDNLTMTADTYVKRSNTEFVLLCHQDGFSRGEYLDTAPVFVRNGYNCMAIDQRSGDAVNGVTNETAAAARQLGLATTYLAAEPDILKAIDKAYAINGNRPIYLLGSSYSASWALLLGKTHTKVKAVIGFSPSENLTGHNITNEIAGYNIPVFVTSAFSETATTANLVANIDAQYLTHYKSTRPGIHGARCLWSGTDGSGEYWNALLTFMGENR